MLFGTWSQAHAYDPSDYMETRLYTANEYSIYHFCIMIKDFHFFSRVIIVQDFETVTFMCYLYTSLPSLLFSVE